MFSVVFVLAALLPLLEPPPRAGKIDRRAIEAFAKKWWQARPQTRFEEWDGQVRSSLLDAAEQMGEIPEGSIGQVRDLLWKHARKYGPRAKKNEIETPYGTATWLMKDRGKGKGLVLGLHGGGEGSGSAAEATRWSMTNCLGMYPQGIRLVHDTWNTVHGECFLLTLIEIAKVQYDIDPDRVYTTGFSMGGTGSWFMAGRHPDLLAGSSPCAGVLMAQPKSQLATKEEVEAIQHGLVPNVRNLAMYYFIGLADQNCMPGTYLYVQDMLDELRSRDPGGYAKIEFTAVPALAHEFPSGEPAAAMKWLGAQVRDAFPDRVVWEYAADPFPRPTTSDLVSRFQKRWYYWLHCDEPADHMFVVAAREGNEIDLQVEGVDPTRFTVLLNPSMIDVEQDVVIRANGEEVFRGRPRPKFRNVVESLDARLDKTLVFDRLVRVGGGRN